VTGPRSAGWRLAALGLPALAAGCISPTRYDAAGDIRAFLVAVRDGDQRTFDAHVDRPALKTNLKARVIEAVAGAHGPLSAQAGGAVLAAGPLADLAVDALVQPQVFRAAAALAGYGPDTRVPGPLVLGHDLQTMDDERVCALVRKRCAFVFKHEDDGVWRLTDFEGDLSLLGRRGAR
jgi:hypothetical protein